jgi:predicted nucleic acid-binding protein
VTIVADSSAVIALSQIGQLALLKILYSSVLIPTAVRTELRSTPMLPPWFEVRTIVERGIADDLLSHLGPGESEVIALALELQIPALLDEARGRSVALQLRVRVIGVVGSLVRAKQRKLIPRVEPLLNELELSGFWVSPRLRELALKTTGEV